MFVTFTMCTIFVSVLFSGIYAHPRGEDRGIEVSKEKRCDNKSCPAEKPLPYPTGWSAETCTDRSTENSQFATPIYVANKKRSMMFATTHIESTDAFHLLENRSPKSCTVVGANHVTDFSGPLGNTGEIFLGCGIVYALAFTFDTRIKDIVAWSNDSGDHYSIIARLNPESTEGILLFRGQGTNVYFIIEFGYDTLYEASFGERPMNLHINGLFTLMELL